MSLEVSPFSGSQPGNRVLARIAKNGSHLEPSTLLIHHIIRTIYIYIYIYIYTSFEPARHSKIYTYIQIIHTYNTYI